MYCSSCGIENDETISFCRRCGTRTAREQGLTINQGVQSLVRSKSKDPDELTSNGIGSIFMGDGFLMVAVLLSVTDSAVSSLLWLALLIPAFCFFGKGFADLLHARQIQRQQRGELNQSRTSGALPPHQPLIQSVTERTTRDLQ
jgi:hypothetical protein